MGYMSPDELEQLKLMMVNDPDAGAGGGAPGASPAAANMSPGVAPQQMMSQAPPAAPPVDPGDANRQSRYGLDSDAASYAAKIADESNAKQLTYDPARDTGARGWLVKQGILKPEALVASEHPTPSLVSYDPKIEREKHEAELAKTPPAPTPPTPAAQPRKPAVGSGVGNSFGNSMNNLMTEADKARQEQIGSRLADNDILDSVNAAAENKSYGDYTAHLEHQQEQARIAGERKQIEDKALASSAQRDDEIRTQLDQLRKEKIDPNHWWADKSTGTTIAAALSMGLGAFGAATPHAGGSGRNMAMELINGAIERDIAAQKTNHEKNFELLAQQSGLAKNEYNRNMFTAEQKQREELLARSKLDATLGHYDTEYNNATVRQKVQELRMGNQDKIDQIKLQGVQDRMTVLQKQQAAQAQAHAAANDPLAGIPPKERAEAMKEYKTAQDYANAQQAMDDAKKNGDRHQMQLATAKLLAVGGVKGKENTDSAAQVGSFVRKLPFADSAEERANQVTAGVSAPSTPTLERYGIRPQTNRPSGGSAGK